MQMNKGPNNSLTIKTIGFDINNSNQSEKESDSAFYLKLFSSNLFHNNIYIFQLWTGLLTYCHGDYHVFQIKAYMRSEIQ